MIRLLAFFMALALAGCVTPPGPDGDANTTIPTTPGMVGALPDPIDDTKQVTGSADPLNVAGAPVCTTPSSQCFRYPFTLASNATFAAELTWTVPANDFDLYLFEDGEQTGDLSGGQPPGTTEAFEADLGPGDYELVVVAWGVGQDTYHVTGTFAADEA